MFSPPFARSRPNPATDLFMSSGRQAHRRHARHARRVPGRSIHDLTTGESGSMTASTANGFAQIKFDPGASSAPSCRTRSTRCTHLERAHPRAVGGALVQRRVLGRDRALRVLRLRRRRDGQLPQRGRAGLRGGLATTSPASTRRTRRSSRSAAVSVATTTTTGRRTRTSGPGHLGNKSSSPTVHVREPALQRDQNYDRIAFETDLPRIEAQPAGPCNRTTGEGCVNPPPGAQFYPIYTTGCRRGLRLADRRADSRTRRTRSVATRRRSTGRC